MEAFPSPILTAFSRPRPLRPPSPRRAGDLPDVFRRTLTIISHVSPELPHTCRRVRRWLRRKFEIEGQGYRQYPDSYLERELGLLNLNRFPRRHSWAKP